MGIRSAWVELFLMMRIRNAVSALVSREASKFMPSDQGSRRFSAASVGRNSLAKTSSSSDRDDLSGLSSRSAVGLTFHCEGVACEVELYRENRWAGAERCWPLAPGRMLTQWHPWSYGRRTER